MNIEERVRKLERQLATGKRRTRWLLFAASLGAALVVAWVLARSGRTHGRIRAESIELADAEGDGVLRLNRSGLSVEDWRGQSRIRLCSYGGSTELSLSAGGKEGGHSFSVNVHDRLGYVTLRPRGPSREDIEADKERLKAGTMDMEAAARRYKQWQAQGVILSVWEGQPSIKLVDADGMKRVIVGSAERETQETGARQVYPPSSIFLLDRKESVIWQAP